MKIFFKGFNFGQDGPGNRLVFHLSGCNMHCPWCSNPEGMNGKSGTDRTVDDIVKEAVSCKPMFFSGGGVTFTGGEATLQKTMLIEVLKRLKKEGIHTALETNGTSEYLPEIAEYVDYLIMDFKHFDGEILKKHTGISNESVKKNFEYFCETGRQLHIRIPIINGFNGENPKRFAKYFSKFDTKNVCFEFLPYHEYGKEKWQEEYKIKNGFITKETLENFNNTFKNHNLKIIKT